MSFTYKSNPFQLEETKKLFIEEVKKHFRFYGENFETVQILMKEKIELIIPDTVADEVINSLWVIDKTVYEQEFFL